MSLYIEQAAKMGGGGLRQKAYQSWVAVPVLFQVAPLYYGSACFDESVVNPGVTMGPVSIRERSVSPPTTHVLIPHEVGDVPVVTVDVVCPGMATQAVCPNLGTTTYAGTHCPCFTQSFQPQHSIQAMRLHLVQILHIL